MKHWKTTLGGTVQCVGWTLFGIAVYADLSGQPKSLVLAHCGLIGACIIGAGALWHGWHSADK